MCQHDRGVITCRFLSTPARIVSTSSKLWSSAATKRNAPSAGARNSSPGFQCLRFLPRGRRLLPLLREHVAVAAIRAVPVPVPCPIWTNSTVGGLRRLEWQSRKCFTPQRKHCDFRDQNRVTGVTCLSPKFPYSRFSQVECNLTMDQPYKSRVDAILPVRIWGLDNDSRPFIQLARAKNISSVGAVVQGLAPQIKPGEIVDVQYEGNKAQFRVIWTGRAGTQRQGEIRIEKLPMESCRSY